MEKMIVRVKALLDDQVLLEAKKTHITAKVVEGLDLVVVNDLWKIEYEQKGSNYCISKIRRFKDRRKQYE